jgi:NAD(P)-dependent dehydrogenase (short-subunit alcohol dehydrogenase family)
MQDFQGKVAVITGGSTGIGYGIAEKCLKKGMKVVIASIGEDTAARAEARLKELYPEAHLLGVRTDVSKAVEVEELARRALDAFGAVDLLFNNAGVSFSGSYIWENTAKDWEWMLGINLMGVVHGVRTFVPIMLAQNTECHIVNTSSMAGVLSSGFVGAYGVSKHAVVALSEILQAQLKERGSKIKVSVLCPGFVKTEFYNAERSRPAALWNETPPDPYSEGFRQVISNGMDPAEVAAKVFRALEDEKFYILTHPQFTKYIGMRMENILEDRDPTYGAASFTDSLSN